MEEEKVLTDENAERAVLAAILLDPASIATLRSRLQPEDFYQTEHKHLYRNLISLSDEGVQISDMVVLPDELRRRKWLEKVGGAGYLAELQSEGFTSANIERHADIVLGYSMRRKAIAEAQRIIRASGDLSVEIHDVLGESGNALAEIGSLQRMERPTLADFERIDYSRFANI